MELLAEAVGKLSNVRNLTTTSLDAKMKIVNEAVINLKAAKELGLEIPTVWGAKWPSIGFAVDNRKAWSLYFRWD